MATALSDKEPPAAAALTAGQFIMAASALFLSPDFSTDAKALYGVLVAHVGSEVEATIAQATLCEQLRLSKNTLRNAVHELETAGLLAVKRGGDGGNARYILAKFGGAGLTESQFRSSKYDNLKSRDAKTEHLNESRSAEFDSLNSRCSDSEHLNESRSSNSEPPTVYIAAAIKAAAAAREDASDGAVTAGAAAANSSLDSVEDQQAPPPSLPDKPASPPLLLALTPTEIGAVAKGDLVQRFRHEFGQCVSESGQRFADIMAAKAKTANRSPTLVLARCILEDWLPYLHYAANAPPAAPGTGTAGLPKKSTKRAYQDYEGD